MFANLTAKLNLNIADFSAKMTEASRKMTRFATNLRSGYANADAALKSHNLGLKDTARIVQGIVISQAFYRAVNAISSATSALWEFNKQLDYATVTYGALFGDARLASDFMGVLQQHSVDTIFDYQSLTDASKKLLAYGIDYKNLMFIMEGLTNLGAMSGDAAALDRISLALGQIYTKGKLSAEEMRQLANAYVPITDIIKEKFNLSEEELSRVGDLNLPAEEVINAIVDYANERFGDVGDAAMYTITGLEAKIVDTLKVVGTQMLAPMTTAYKSFLVYITKGLEGIRNAYAQGGVGGVFEFLVPDEHTQQVLRTFFANIRNFFSSVAALARSASGVFKQFGQVVISLLNVFLPVLNQLISALAVFVDTLNKTTVGSVVLKTALLAAAAAFIVMKVQAIGALVVTAVTKAVLALSKALLVLSAIIVKHPIISILVALGVALAGVSVMSDKAGSSLSGLFDGLADLGGYSGKDMLSSAEQSISSSNEALDKFNNRLEAGTDTADELENNIDGVGSAIDRATKKAGLLSFDEVYKLNDPAASGAGLGSGLGIDTTEIENMLKGLDALENLGELLIPEIPDFSEFASSFTDSLLGSISDSLKRKIAIGGWGALIGAILGGLLTKNAAGVKWGSAAGAIVANLFDEIDWKVNNSASGLTIGLVAAIGKSLAKSGAQVGLGTIIKNAFVNGGFKGVWTALSTAIKNTGKNALTKGGLLGIAIGFVADLIYFALWDALEKKFSTANAETAGIGQFIGGIAGTIIGAFVGGVPGAAIGGILGSGIGGVIGLWADDIGVWFEQVYSDVEDWGSELIDNIRTWWDDLITSIDEWWVDVAQSFREGCEELWQSIVDWTVDTAEAIDEWRWNVADAIHEWYYETIEAIGEWCTDTADAISDWCKQAWKDVSNWCVNAARSIGNWCTQAWRDFTNWCSNVGRAIADWCVTAWKDVSAWCVNAATAIAYWCVTAFNDFSNWCVDVGKAIADWCVQAWKDVSNWCVDVGKAIAGWCTQAWRDISNWCVNAGNDIAGWCVRAWNDISNWCVDILATIGKFFVNLGTAIGTWFSDTWNSISTWFTNLGKNIATWWNNLFNPDTWVTGWNCVKQWFSGLFTGVSNWFISIGGNIATWWNGLWDPSNWTSAWNCVKQWFSNLFSDISKWFKGLGRGIKDAWKDIWDFDGSVTFNPPSYYYNIGSGHAEGGIFNREHVARFAEGNKAEAIIPLENNRAMQPFVDAVANGLTSSLAPLMANGTGSGNQLPPMYVGTLVADERGLRELYKKFEVINLQENARKGTPATGGVF